MFSSMYLWVVFAVIAVIAIMVYTYEGFCGGADQSCVCSGNETMTAGPKTAAELTKILNRS